MARRTLHPAALVTAAALLACLLALLAAPRDAEAAFPGQNGAIAFVSDRGGHPEQVYRMEPDGTEVRSITDVGPPPGTDPDNWGGSLIRSPTWSPDGGRIAWSDDTCVNNGGYCNTIFVAGADGSDATPLDFNLDAIQPAWFPSGDRLVVSAGFDDYHLHALSFDAGGNVTEATQLTTEGRYNTQPAVSPDGEKIAFQRGFSCDGDGCGGLDGIYVMDASSPEGPSNRPVRIAGGSGPDWWPGGEKVAFAAYRDGNADVYVMRADGTKKRRLTTSPAFEGDPVWSPNGKKIAFSRSTAGGDRQVWKMRTDGTRKTRLTDESENTSPSWQPLP
jgi:Tol biopolymer transport system component